MSDVGGSLKRGAFVVVVTVLGLLLLWWWSSSPFGGPPANTIPGPIYATVGPPVPHGTPGFRGTVMP